VPRAKTNGLSIKTILQDNPGIIPERTLYWEFGKQAGDPNSGIVGEVFQAARRGLWKAVRYSTEEPVEVYNIDNDPAESNELSGSFPNIHQQFVKLFAEHLN
jgi:arylsulfatase A